MDIKAGDARVQTNLETNLGAAEIKTNASIAEAIDVLDSSFGTLLQEYKVEVEGEFDKAKTASDRYVDDIVTPAIAAVESTITITEQRQPRALFRLFHKWFHVRSFCGTLRIEHTAGT